MQKETGLDNYQRFIHVSRYARYIPELKRRETFEETVTRLTDFIKKHQPKLGKDIDKNTQCSIKPRGNASHEIVNDSR